jgi:hypothetical protein
MVGPWPHRPFTFRALSKTYGQMWLRCDVCRRYARLNLAGLHDVDYRTKTFSCSRCGAEAWMCVVEPIKESGLGLLSRRGAGSGAPSQGNQAADGAAASADGSTAANAVAMAGGFT